MLYAHLCLLLLQRALFSVSIVPFQLQWKCLVIHAKEKPRLEKNAFRLLDHVFLYTTGPKVIGFQFSLLDWSLLVLAAHGPHLEVFRLTNVICGHMLDYSVLSSDLWLYRCSNL